MLPLQNLSAQAKQERLQRTVLMIRTTSRGPNKNGQLERLMRWSDLLRSRQIRTVLIVDASETPNWLTDEVRHRFAMVHTQTENDLKREFPGLLEKRLAKLSFGRNREGQRRSIMWGFHAESIGEMPLDPFCKKDHAADEGSVGVSATIRLS